MSIDPATIELTPLQKERLAAIAERTGRDYTRVVDDLLAAVPLPQTDKPNGSGPKNLLEAWEAVGAIGCFEGPPDLSTNPKYMEGFGTNAGHRHAD